MKSELPPSLSTSSIDSINSAGSIGEKLRRDPAYQAFWLLRIGFTVAPILFGLDKFANVLTTWDKYLSPRFDSILPGNAHQAMLAIGVIEILAGISVLIAPRFGAYLVAAWLAGIILNLLLIPGYYDVALRDFALMLAALTLARLAAAFPSPSTHL